MPIRALINGRGIEPELECTIFDVYVTICQAAEINAEVYDLLTRAVLSAILEAVDAGETEASKILQYAILRLGISSHVSNGHKLRQIFKGLLQGTIA
jgi:hypothetical protein